MIQIVIMSMFFQDDVSRYVFERERAKYKDIIELPVGDREQLLWALKEVDLLPRSHGKLPYSWHSRMFKGGVQAIFLGGSIFSLGYHRCP